MSRLTGRWAHLIDRFFISLLKRRMRARQPPALSEADLAAAMDTMRHIEEHALRFEPPPFLDRRTLMRPRPLRFHELVVRYEQPPFALPVPPGPTRPPVVHVQPARGEARGGLVLLHGWGQATLGTIGRFGRYAAARGVATACLELPEHLSRRLPGRRAGEGFVTLDARRMLPALYYAVFETEWVRRGMAEALGLPVGVLGASIGGWLACLHVLLFEPAFVCLVSPAANPPYIFMHTDLFDGLRRPLSEPQLDVLAAILGALDPVEREPLLPGRLISILTGRHDLITPYESVSAFAGNAGARPLKVVPHGHFSILFFYPELFQTVFAELESLLAE